MQKERPILSNFAHVIVESGVHPIEEGVCLEKSLHYFEYQFSEIYIDEISWATVRIFKCAKCYKTAGFTG